MVAGQQGTNKVQQIAFTQLDDTISADADACLVSQTNATKKN